MQIRILWGGRGREFADAELGHRHHQYHHKDRNQAMTAYESWRNRQIDVMRIYFNWAGQVQRALRLNPELCPRIPRALAVGVSTRANNKTAGVMGVRPAPHSRQLSHSNIGISRNRTRYPVARLKIVYGRINSLNRSDSSTFHYRHHLRLIS